jgi:hypothetical protein
VLNVAVVLALPDDDCLPERGPSAIVGLVAVNNNASTFREWFIGDLLGLLAFLLTFKGERAKPWEVATRA